MKSLGTCVIVILTLAGCQTVRARATMLERDRPSADSPVNLASGGRLRYPVRPGNPRDLQAYRTDAFRQMSDYCGGQYELVNEYDQVEEQLSTGLSAQVAPGAVGVATTQPSLVNHYLQFRCIKAPLAESVAPPDRG